MRFIGDLIGSLLVGVIYCLLILERECLKIPLFIVVLLIKDSKKSDPITNVNDLINDLFHDISIPKKKDIRK